MIMLTMAFKKKNINVFHITSIYFNSIYKCQKYMRMTNFICITKLEVMFWDYTISTLYIIIFLS